ncbi:hypothetical protein HDU98_010963, partial [Podochytrium sp. JEL0797]
MKLQTIVAAASTLVAPALAYDFAWGFGGSAYQTEGAWNLNGKQPNVQDHWYNNPPHLGEANANVATDQFHHYKEDLALLPGMGATLYRFSVSWSRVMNDCTGSVNPEGIQFYHDYIDEMIANGVVPFLTMFHWDLPQTCFDQFQGFANDRIIDEFVIYADLLYKEFGSKVQYWLTINEPESNCKFGYQQGRLAPGLKNSTYHATIDCVHRTHLLHAAVVKHAHANYDTKGLGWKFGYPSNAEWNEPKSSSAADIAAAEARNLAYMAWYHDPVVFGTYKDDMIEAFKINHENQDATGSAPPAFSASEQELMKGTVDFIAMNYYSTAGIPASQELVPSGAGCGSANMCWQHTWAQGLRKMANWYYKRYNMDIIVTEVGYAGFNEASMTVDEVVNNPDRLKFWQGHLQELTDAVEVDKVPIKGVLIWSLLDNFEWGYYDQKFGAVLVVGLGDANGSLQRIVKNSTNWIVDFFKDKAYNNHFVSHELETKPSKTNKKAKRGNEDNEGGNAGGKQLGLDNAD